MAGAITGQVVSVNESGNLVTDITAEALRSAPTDERVTVRCDEHETSGIFPADHDQPDMTYVALIGKSDCLELSIVGDSAKAMLGVGLGTPVTVKW